MLKLQLVQDVALCVLARALWFDSAMPSFWQLHWLSIQFWTLFKVLMIKALHGMGWGYLKDCLLWHHPVLPWRTSGRTMLRIPPPSKLRGWLQAAGSSPAVAPHLWIEFHEDLRTTPSLHGFQKDFWKSSIFNSFGGRLNFFISLVTPFFNWYWSVLLLQCFLLFYFGALNLLWYIVS